MVIAEAAIVDGFQLKSVIAFLKIRTRMALSIVPATAHPRSVIALFATGERTFGATNVRIHTRWILGPTA
jgi:hypothetical protein